MGRWRSVEALFKLFDEYVYYLLNVDAGGASVLGVKFCTFFSSFGKIGVDDVFILVSGLGPDI